MTIKGTLESDTVASQSLATVYGDLVAPKTIDQLEASVTPRSMQKLSSDTARLLRRLMKATADGLGVSQFVYNEIPILWIVDREGDVWFGVEEIIDINTKQFVRPRVRRTDVTRGYARLGHPAFLRGAPGRLGGEIIFDADGSVPRWYITNASGRYGVLRGRQLEHLINVRVKFEGHGIDLTEQFYSAER